ncbi:cell wall metabolism sensor histidine kinase WalK [Methylocystis sp. ATCC 49242]|uniref:sensor histidine kinase n=1 Tax=Methylocystis sp. ATCC 49242 TaxID=622637 RepID=UPI0001F87874|nr:HAMP domain-containing sensor histidine kinase [Methylocystis sp. ATCC 49242]
MKAPSLLYRLFFYNLMAQFPASAVAWLTVTLLMFFGVAIDFNLEPDDFAYHRISELVVDSLVKGHDGELRISPTKNLQQQIALNPRLKYAVFDPKSGEAAQGSSQELLGALRDPSIVRTHYVDFSLPGDAPPGARGTKSRKLTPFGFMYVAAYGYRFAWSDLFYTLRSDISPVTLHFASGFAAAAIVTWFAVQRALAPIHELAAQAERIDMDSLGQGIRAENVPSEIRPLVNAVNQALERLDAAAKRMRRFTANAAHELRTPVAIMRARLEDPDEANLRADLVRDASQIQSIVEQMLIAARLTENQTTVDDRVELVGAIRQLVSDYMPLVVDCGRRIEFESREAQIFALGNRRAIECVVGNLIDNALRAEPPGGTVLVRVDADATIDVIDHGEGVAPQDKARIFEPFWRKSEATPGTGLGLSIAKELMDMHGGRIWVEETPGGGATFRISLPGPSTVTGN